MVELTQGLVGLWRHALEMHVARFLGVDRIPGPYGHLLFFF